LKESTELKTARGHMTPSLVYLSMSVVNVFRADVAMASKTSGRTNEGAYIGC